MKKQIISLILITSLISVLLSACSESGSVSNPEQSGEPLATSEQSIAAMETAELASDGTEASQSTTVEVTEPVRATATSGQAVDAVTTKRVSETLNSADYRLEVRSNPIYEVEAFNDDLIASPAGPGAINTYEDLVSGIMYEQPLNFIKFEIIDVYTREEAVEITRGEIDGEITTLYKARIIYDYLNQERVDIEINIAKSGTATRQWRGNPPYEIGSEYTAELILNGILDGESNWCVAGSLVMAIHEISGVEFAYSRNDNIKFIDSRGNLDVGVLDSERSIVTTTRNNPAEFSQKFLVDEVAEFIRYDWKERGFEFIDFSNYQ